MNTVYVVTVAVCECSDSLCPHCKGKCASEPARLLFRVDMQDNTGTLMCNDCADDAWESGLFVTKE